MVCGGGVIDIDMLVRLEKKATPGPWAYDMGNWEVEKEDGRNPVCLTNNHGDDDIERLGYGHDDGEFIASMRNSINELLAVYLDAKHLSDNLETWYLLPDGKQHLKLAMKGLRESLDKLSGGGVWWNTTCKL